MNKLILLTILAAAAAIAQPTYSTSFPNTENPISQGGQWTTGHAAGAGTISGGGNCNPCWGNVQSSPNLGFGADIPTTFGDPTAILTGSWPATQVASIKLGTINAMTTTVSEIQVRLRMTISAGSITGYEILCPVNAGTGNSFQVVRWNGQNGNFAPISGGNTGTHFCTSGTVITAAITGTNPAVITVYENGTVVSMNTGNTSPDDGTDPPAGGPFTSGNPGIGMYGSGGTNWSDAGVAQFFASDGRPILTTTTAASITNTTATAGGNAIYYNVGATVEGVCYGLSANPTTAGTCQNAAGTPTAFSVNLSGLSAGTTYHYRSFSTNSIGTAYGQDLTFTTTGTSIPWIPILAASRAIDWSHAGLPPSYPDGETTTNPWTPPTGRTQCGATVNGTANASTDLTNIQNAISACTAGHFVQLAGNFTLSGTLGLYNKSGVTTRGTGPQSTTLTLTGNASIAFGGSFGTGGCTGWSGGPTFAVGVTSITMTGCSGSTPQIGTLLALRQCNSGWSGVGCGTGSDFDNGGLFLCSNAPGCARTASGSDHKSQKQVVYVTSVSPANCTGTGTCTFTFSPGLYMPNWGATVNGQYSTPFADWQSGPGGGVADPWGIGLEDLTVLQQSDTPQGSVSGHTLEMNYSYGSWLKGVRLLALNTAGAPNPIETVGAKNALVMNNYLFGGLALTHQFAPSQIQNDSDTLILNNTSQSTYWMHLGRMQGDVFGYNYAKDAFAMDTNGFFEHGEGGCEILYEGNNVDSDEDDDTNGTHCLNTRFREYVRGSYPPYAAVHPSALTFNEGSRFENVIGSSLGTTTAPAGSQLTNYIVTSAGIFSYAYAMNFGAVNDPLVQQSAMLWGNYDTATNSIRFINTENPTGLTGNAAPFNNIASPSQMLPPSFFITGVAAHPNGGTGLSWWKVCTAWSTFPTACSSTQTPPFPPVGPDVASGSINLGTVNDIPAVVAQKNLPIDTSWQQAFSVTASSWSGGTETLTVSGFATGNATNNDNNHIMGGFQLTGIDSRCLPTSGASFTGRPDNEILITSSSVASVATVTYALPVNPTVACNGTFNFPDVRQFDERVYQSDALITGSPTITTTTLPSGTVNAAYSQSVSATGTAPITWTLASGSLPAGLTGCNNVTGASCTISGTPTTAQTSNFTLQAANGILPNAQQALAITIQPPPVPGATLGCTPHNFGNQIVGTTSGGFPCTLTNTGTAQLTITAITPSGDFADTSDCPLSPAHLAIGNFCTITTTFTPTLTGLRNGPVSITDDAPNSPQSIVVQGTGVPSVTGSVSTGVFNGVILHFQQ